MKNYLSVLSIVVLTLMLYSCGNKVTTTENDSISRNTVKVFGSDFLMPRGYKLEKGAEAIRVTSEDQIVVKPFIKGNKRITICELHDAIPFTDGDIKVDKIENCLNDLTIAGTKGIATKTKAKLKTNTKTKAKLKTNTKTKAKFKGSKQLDLASMKLTGDIYSFVTIGGKIVTAIPVTEKNNYQMNRSDLAVFIFSYKKGVTASKKNLRTKHLIKRGERIIRQGFNANE